MHIDILHLTCQKGATAHEKGHYGSTLAQIDYTNADSCLVDSILEDCYWEILQGLFKATFPNAKFNALDAVHCV